MERGKVGARGGGRDEGEDGLEGRGEAVVLANLDLVGRLGDLLVEESDLDSVKASVSGVVGGSIGAVLVVLELRLDLPGREVKNEDRRLCQVRPDQDNSAEAGYYRST